MVWSDGQQKIQLIVLLQYHKHHQTTVSHPVHVFECLLSGDASASKNFSHLVRPQLEVFAFVVAVVSPQQ